MKDNNNKEYRLPKDVKLATYLLYFSSVFFLFFYGFCNTEDYESIISAIVAQEYFHISKDMGFWEINVVIIPFISWVNSFFPGVQLYGYYIFFITALVGFLGVHLIIDFKNINRNKKFLISLSFIIFYSINLINLQSTRVAVILIFIFLIHYTFNTLSKFKLVLIFIMSIVLRIDAVVLLSLSYVVINFIMNKHRKVRVWFPFIISFTLLLFLNFAVSNFGNEGVKKFYYYEIELSEKQNIDFQSLTKENKLILDYWYSHIVFDENFYKTSFIKEIIAVDEGHFVNNLISPKLYMNTLLRSTPEISEIKLLLIFSFLLIFLNFMFLKKLRFKLLLLYLFFFPLVICFYISIPTRFLYPYYTTLILFCIILIPCQKKVIVSLLIPILFIIISYGSKLNYEYSNQKNAFHTTMNKVNKLSKTYGKDLFIEGFHDRSWNFTTSDIKYVYQGNHVHFINFAYFQYFDFYKNDWANVNQAINYESILEKIQYLEKTNQPFIIDNESYIQVYKNYLFERYYRSKR